MLAAASGEPDDFGPMIDIVAVYEQELVDCNFPAERCDAYQDILATFGPAATPELVASVAVATMQDALTRSGTGVGVRLVGVQPLNFNIQDDTCDARADINGGVSPQAQAVAQIRSAAGADVALVMSSTLLGGVGTTGCAANPPAPTVAGNQASSFAMVVKVRSGSTDGPWFAPASTTVPGAWNVYSHELGHILALGHDRTNRIFVPAGTTTRGEYHPALWEDRSGKAYAFGFVSCSSAPVVATQTVMGNFEPRACDTTSQVNITSTITYNRYSNPYMFLPVTSGPAIPAGTLSPVHTGAIPANLTTAQRNIVLARTTDAARRVREIAKIVADYNTPPTLLVAGVLDFPAPGSTLPANGDQEFRWQPSGLAGTANEQYVFEIGTPNTVLLTSGLPSSPTSFSVNMASIPDFPAVIVARLWSRVGVGQWTWNEVRYNNGGRWIGCSSDPGTAIVYPEMAQYPCMSGGSPVCTIDASGSIASCSLAHIGGMAPPAMHVAARPTGSARYYDAVVMGQDRAGQGFCCMLSDNTDSITDLNLSGSGVADDFVLNTGGFDLRSWSSTGLACDVGGADGNDHIFGSASSDSNFAETLRGENGADQIFGNGGDDILLGGSGNDTLDGGDGWDVILGKLGNDSSIGGAGWDVLCEQDFASLMRGRGAANTADWDTLYYVSGLTGTINPSTNVDSPFASCGYNGYTQTWGSCPAYNLGSPPSSCVPFLP